MKLKNIGDKMLFNIISAENFDSVYGFIKKGEIINTVQFKTHDECKQWVYDKYGPMGENIKVKIREVKQ